MDLISISYTPIDSSGGVPRWNRDFKRCFPEMLHYSWWDCPMSRHPSSMHAQEWDKARVLNAWLRHEGKIKKDDIIIVDGFWGIGLEDHPNVVSVCHGIWSHLIKEEADVGKRPDFPLHHVIQVDYRRKHLARNGRLVAVSLFIADQMRSQWGFESIVINNAIDLEIFLPIDDGHDNDVPLVLHGVNDKDNPVKGWEHIEFVSRNMMIDLMSLDQAFARYGTKSKYDCLAMADVVLIPSAYEGNSYFLLETLSCDVPVVTYDVGLAYELKKNGSSVGVILDRKNRSKESTLDGMRHYFADGRCFSPRESVAPYSIDHFGAEWGRYLKGEFGWTR